MGDVIVAEDDDKRGRNRQVLGDIGNVVRRNYSKNDQAAKITTRPRTRSQQASLVDEIPKNKPVNKRFAIPKPKKVAAGKSEVIEIIEISSDSDEEVIKEKKITKKNKKQTSYTSVLTARSKAACGLAKKPKDLVDIDAVDAKNDLAAVEYVEDIYTFYKSVEVQVNGVHEITCQRNLTVNIMDRFLSVKSVPRNELQLVGLSALLISSKYEEIWPPQVEDLVDIADHAYDHKQILVMEKTILGALEWYLTVPTHYVFLARFIKASIADQQMENMVNYLVELSVMHYDTTIMFTPSMVAASAIYAARSALHQVPVWTNTLKHHTGYSETQLMDCAKLLAYQQWKQQEKQERGGEESSDNKGGALKKKYSKDERCCVALIPPAKSLLTGTESV